MKRITTTLILLMLVFAATSGLASSNGAPWPPDLSITKPEANVPANLIPFIGKWSGSSNSGMAVNMAIEKIYISEFGLLKIQTVYAWDNKYVSAGWSRQTASWDETYLVFTLKENSLKGAQISCTIPKGDSLSCQWVYSGSGSASFKREK